MCVCVCVCVCCASRHLLGLDDDAKRVLRRRHAGARSIAPRRTGRARRAASSSDSASNVALNTQTCACGAGRPAGRAAGGAPHRLRDFVHDVTQLVNKAAREHLCAAPHHRRVVRRARRPTVGFVDNENFQVAQVVCGA